MAKAKYLVIEPKESEEDMDKAFEELKDFIESYEKIYGQIDAINTIKTKVTKYLKETLESLRRMSKVRVK